MALGNFIINRWRRDPIAPVLICYDDAETRIEVSISTATMKALLTWPDDLQPTIADLNLMASGNFDTLVEIVTERFAAGAFTELSLAPADLAGFDQRLSLQKLVEAGSAAVSAWALDELAQ